MAHPSLSDEADKYRLFFREKGIPVRFMPFVGSYNGRDYPKSYTPEELKIFGLEKSDHDKFYPRNKLCNAGYNVALVLPSGDLISCFPLHKRMGNIYKKIVFSKTLLSCSSNWCACPTYAYDPYLYQRALQEASTASEG